MTRRGTSRIVLAAVLLAALAPALQAQGAKDLRVGHWVVVKGELGIDGHMTADSVEVLEPAERQALLGDVTRVSADGRRFWVLDQAVEISDKTAWRKTSALELAGQRVKVEGYYRGPGKFSAREVARREKGRDRIVGRIDRLQRAPGGFTATVMWYSVSIPADLEIVSSIPIESVPLAPAMQFGTGQRRRDDDDDVPQNFRINDVLSFGARLEWKTKSEDNFDLDDDLPQDRIDHNLVLRSEFVWQPSANFQGLLGLRQRVRYRDDEVDGTSTIDQLVVAEAYGMWRDYNDPHFILQAGRQDFDEKREWLYDQNLDALRLIYTRPSLRAELSASTRISQGSPRDENTDNLIAYVSNNDEDRHLAGYVIDRRDNRDPQDYPLHIGLRALGEWLPRQDVWAELSVLRGWSGSDTLEGYGFDLGTTWSPDALDPWYFTVGYAFGSGDDQPLDGTDNAFHQSGLQDNNDKFGGVTSFRYYGELLEPELSNLAILTLGIGRRIGKRSSIDLVFHGYEQDVAASFLRDANLDLKPDGVHRNLGWETDLIFGSRALSRWHFEVVLAAFEPGDAFGDADTAYFGKLQARLKF